MRDYNYIIRKLATSSGYNGIMPEGVKIDKVHFGYGLFATKFFAKESTVYIASRYVIPDEQADYELIMTYTGEKFLINTIHYTRCKM